MPFVTSRIAQAYIPAATGPNQAAWLGFDLFAWGPDIGDTGPIHEYDATLTTSLSANANQWIFVATVGGEGLITDYEHTAGGDPALDGTIKSAMFDEFDSDKLLRSGQFGSQLDGVSDKGSPPNLTTVSISEIVQLGSSLPAGSDLTIVTDNPNVSPFTSYVNYEDAIAVAVAMTISPDFWVVHPGVTVNEDLYDNNPGAHGTGDSVTYPGFDRDPGFGLFLRGTIAWDDPSQDPVISGDDWIPITTYKNTGTGRQLCICIVGMQIGPSDHADHTLTATFASPVNYSMILDGTDLLASEGLHVWHPV